MPRRLALVLCCCAVAVRGDMPAAETAKTIKCPPGFKATVFAAEPMVVNPTNMAIDSRGRVWVTEGLNYRFFANGQFQRVPGADRIKILEDTDGDGVADKVTVFADNIYPVPMGLAIQEKWKDGKYVGCRVFTGNSPDLLVFEDTKGDDHADKREVLLTGFGGYDSDHGVHGMFLALDGKLYFTQGDGKYGGRGGKPIPNGDTLHVTDRSGKTISHRKDGSVLRCDPDGKNLELLATGLRNNYGVAVDSFGDIFASDNDDDGNRGCRMCWILPGAHYGYHTPGSPRHWGEDVPGNMPKLVGTGNGSPAGILVYEGKLFPKEVQGAVLQVDAGTRQINLHPLTRHGAGWRTEYKVLVSGGADAQFRPVDAGVEHDGALLVADWYDAGVGGHRFTDQTTGRIYRIAPVGHKPSKPKPDFGSDEGMVMALQSPNQTTAVAAADLLRQRAIAAEVTGAVYAPAPDKLIDHMGMARWHWMLRGNVFVSNEDAGDNRIADVLTRTASQRRTNKYNPKVPAVARLLLEQELGEKLSPDDAVKHALRWDGNDRFFLELLRIHLLNAKDGAVAKVFAALAAAAEKELSSNGAIPLPPYYPVGANDSFPLPGDKDIPATAASKLIGVAWVLERAEALPALQALAAKNSNPDVQRGIEMAVGRIKDPQAAEVLAGMALSKNPGAVRSALAVLGAKLGREWSTKRNTPKMREAFDAALANDGLRVEAIRALASAGMQDYAGKLMGYFGDEKADLGVRAAALEALGRLKHHPAQAIAEKLVADAAGKTLAPPLAGPALAALADLAGGEANALLEKTLADARQPAELRRRALQLLLRETQGAQRLLSLHKDRKLAAELVPEATFQLNNHSDGRVRDRARREMPLPTANGRSIGDAAKLLDMKADPVAGEKSFRTAAAGTTACGACHRVQGLGQWVGPDLSAIGVKYDRKELLYHIVNPSGAIAHGYQTTILQTDDGKTLAGLVVEETAERLTLKTAQNDRLALAKAAIAARKESPISVMPEKLADSMSDQQLADLLAYLATLRQPVAEAGAIQVMGPWNFPADGGPPAGVAGNLARVAASRDGWFDVSAILPAKNDLAAVALATIDSPVAQTGTLVVASKSPVVAWLGTTRVPLTQAGDAWSGRVELPAGETPLAIRLGGGALNPGLSITVVSPTPVRFGAK